MHSSSEGTVTFQALLRTRVCDESYCRAPVNQCRPTTRLLDFDYLALLYPSVMVQYTGAAASSQTGWQGSAFRTRSSSQQPSTAGAAPPGEGRGLLHDWRMLSRTSKLFAARAAVIASIGGLLFGYDIGVVEGALPQLRDELHLSLGQQDMVVAIMVAGAITGTANVLRRFYYCCVVLRVSYCMYGVVWYFLILVLEASVCTNVQCALCTT